MPKLKTKSWTFSDQKGGKPLEFPRIDTATVTGTGTGVGKTVVTAAVAALAPGRVAVLKPAQTGVGPDEPGDLGA